METKKHIRQEIFSRRKAASDREILEGSRKIFEAVRALPEYREAASVYAYMDCRHEVMTREFIQAAWADGKQVAVPKVDGKNMVFYTIRDFGELEEGYYGIQEPVVRREARAEDALVIVPGVAFDRERRRIGYGGGFYDKYLASHEEIITAALGYDFQIVEKVPSESHDRRMDYLIY